MDDKGMIKTRFLTVTNADGCSAFASQEATVLPLPGAAGVITALPSTYNPGATIVPGGTIRCFDAVQTIYIGGSGSTVAVLDGGSATMIAGLNIIYQPGTHAEHGSYMHGYITGNGQYCGGQAPAMVTVEVLNASGVKALSEEISGERKHLFSISSSPPGLYFIHILSGEKTETLKLIKM
jgi:hypothetical protein